MSMNFGTNLVPSTDSDYSLGNSTHKWENLYVDNINGAAYQPTVPPLIITTTNSAASDSLTAGAQTLTAGQLLFVFLNAAMNGTSNASITFGSGSAINLYIDSSTRLKAPYKAGSLLGFIYHSNNLYMINPPVSV